MRNDFYGSGVAVFPLGTPINTIYFGRTENFPYSGTAIVMGDFNKKWSKDFESLKENLKPGLKDLKALNIIGKEYGWSVVFPMINTQIQLGVNSTDSLFIEEMTIVPQVRIIPEMHNESIIVEMKMKGDFGELGKLDCIIKTKFYFYEEYLGPYY